MAYENDDDLLDAVMADFEDKHLWASFAADATLSKRVNNILYEARSKAESRVRELNLQLAKSPDDEILERQRNSTLSFIGRVTGRQKFLKATVVAKDYRREIRRHKYEMLTSHPELVTQADEDLWASLGED